MKRILAPILLLTLLFPSLALGGEVTIPENSFSQGANWYCHNGFKADRVNNKCISIGAVTVTGWCQLRVASSFLL